MLKQKKTAVLLLNLGTPDSPKTRDVRRYLTEFLNDPRVIDIPPLWRSLLVNLIIVPFRAPKSAKIYQELWDMYDGKSPLLEYGKGVQHKLQDALGDQLNGDVYLAMRYGNPSMPDVLEEIRKKNYEQLIVLPLYPQYASASTGSTIDRLFELMKDWYVFPEVKVISQFYDHPRYIEAVAEQAKQFDLKSYDHIIFSYHGLPVRQVDKVYEDRRCANHSCEDEINEENKFCYKATCYATTRAVAELLDIKEDEYTVAFQSRLNEKWLEPFSDKVIEELGQKGAKKLLVFSPAFISDCLETSVEIGVEYQEILEEHGGEKVQLVPSLNEHPIWIQALKEMIESRL